MKVGSCFFCFVFCDTLRRLQVFFPFKNIFFPPGVGMGATLPPQAAAAPNAVPAAHQAPPAQAAPQPGQSAALLAQHQQHSAAFLSPQQQVGILPQIHNDTRLHVIVFVPSFECSFVSINC